MSSCHRAGVHIHCTSHSARYQRQHIFVPTVMNQSGLTKILASPASKGIMQRYIAARINTMFRSVLECRPEPWGTQMVPNHSYLRARACNFSVRHRRDTCFILFLTIHFIVRNKFCTRVECTFPQRLYVVDRENIMPFRLAERGRDGEGEKREGVPIFALSREACAMLRDLC